MSLLRPGDRAGSPLPYCNAEQGKWADEVARIEREIAEIRRQDIKLARDQRLLAQQMQAAQFQRDILAAANQERIKEQRKKPRRVLRRRATRRPPTADPAGPRIPPAAADRDRAAGRAAAAPGAWTSTSEGLREEASPREIQNVYLGLGALLLGVAAVVFAGVTPYAIPRLAILAGAAALMLGVAPFVRARQLSSTAETVSAVGLILVPLIGYALYLVPAVATGPVPGEVFGGIVFAVTAAIAAVYASATGLSAPRYATVLALQPVIPLLAYRWIDGPAGWAFSLPRSPPWTSGWAGSTPPSAPWSRPPGRPGWSRRRPPSTSRPAAASRPGSGSAAAPATPTRAPARHRRPDAADGPPSRTRGRATTGPGSVSARGPARCRPTAAQGVPDRVAPVPGQRTDDESADRPAETAPRRESRRPEGAAEEAEVLIDAGPADAPVSGPPPQTEVAARWLREMSWVLFGIAIGAALIYAVAGLVEARTVPAATVGGIALVLAAAIGLVGSLQLRRRPLPDVAGAVMTLAIIGAAGRVASVALPGHALVVVAAIIALIGLAVRALPDESRRGPQLASTAALLVIGMVIAGNTLRAAIAPIEAALPMWRADLTTYTRSSTPPSAPRSGSSRSRPPCSPSPPCWPRPQEVRRELAVAGAALTALAAPASFGLGWAAAPWPPVVAAIAIGVAGLWARTDRAGVAHAVGAAVVGLAAAGASTARPALTAAVLFVIAAGGALIAAAARGATDPRQRRRRGGRRVGGRRRGVRLPRRRGQLRRRDRAEQRGHRADPGGRLPRGLRDAQLRRAQPGGRATSPVPLTVGTGLGAMAVAAAAFAAPQATVADKLVGALMLVAAVLLFLAPSIDHGRRADRMLDGADFASAAATTALIGALARIAAILAPGGEIATVAAMILRGRDRRPGAAGRLATRAGAGHRGRRRRDRGDRRLPVRSPAA